MSKAPIVSVILPNHNYDDFIADAIESIRAQTLKDWECIIIDDASTDNSVQIIQDLIQGDDRFKLIALTEPVGVSAARNAGLDAATGEYIAFLDSDDCYTEYALEMLVKLAKDANVDVAGARVKFVDGYFKFAPSNDAWTTDGYTLHDNYKNMLMALPEYKWIWIWRRIYKRSVIGNTRFPSDMKINGDDISFMLDIAWNISKFAESPSIGIYHRVHPLSITSEAQDFNSERVRVFPMIFKHIREDLLDKYDDEFFRKLYDNLFTYMLSECIVKTKGQSDPETISFLRGILKESCKLIPMKYLKLKQKLLCWYLSCLK